MSISDVHVWCRSTQYKRSWSLFREDVQNGAQESIAPAGLHDPNPPRIHLHPTAWLGLVFVGILAKKKAGSSEAGQRCASVSPLA